MFFFLHRASRIGVVQLYGAIGSAIKAPVYEPIFESLRKSRRIKAVVLDIDSPGGSASASEYLYAAVGKVAAVKPVASFIRGTGASGAYMLACGSHRIIAQPAAVVGSIGVISIRPIVEELLQKLGMSVVVTKSGRLKDMGAPWRQPTDEENKKFQEITDYFYGHFVEMVAQARKLDKDKVRGLATGEIYTATQAKELGLIDEVGDMDRALDVASELGHVARKPIYIRPRRGLFQRVFGGMSDSLVESVAAKIEERLTTRILYM